MKVKVRSIKPPYTDTPTESLQAILRNHAHDRLYARVSLRQLYEIMDILAERRDASGYRHKTTEEALADFKRQYMPKCGSQLHIDYAGGFDHYLLELSDVLPASLYAPGANKPATKKK